MKIKINIEKKHLYYLTFLVSLLLMGLVIATGYQSGEPFHQILYTNTITGKSSDVTVDDALTVTEKLTVRDDMNIKGNLKIIDGKIDFKTDPQWNTKDTSSSWEGLSIKYESWSMGPFSYDCDNGKIMVGLEVKTVSGGLFGADTIDFASLCIPIEDILSS